jgi:hypothetical protein
MEEGDVMYIRNLMLVGSGLALALSLPATAFADPVVLTASLDGAGEAKGGDPDGSGSFSAEIDIETGDVCYLLAVEKIADAMAAHIHKGAAGKSGKPVTAIDVTGPDDDLCIALEPSTLEKIVAMPGNYYVNVHTADFPAGAVRGQLVNPAAPEPTDEAIGEATDEATGEAAEEAVEETVEAATPAD